MSCRLTVCQRSDSGVRLTVNRGWRGRGLHVPHGFFFFRLASCVSIFLSHPHMLAQVLTKPRIVGRLGTYGAERRWNEEWKEREGRCQGNVFPLSQKPGECDGRMDNCYSRQLGRKLGQIWCVLRAESLTHKIMHKSVKLTSPVSSLTPLLHADWTAFVYILMFSLFSRWDVVVVHRRARAHTQTRANSQCSHVDRVLELWLQACSACVRVCVCVVFGYSPMIGAAPSRACLSLSVASSHSIIISLSLSLSLYFLSFPLLSSSSFWIHCSRIYDFMMIQAALEKKFSDHCSSFNFSRGTVGSVGWNKLCHSSHQDRRVAGMLMVKSIDDQRVDWQVECSL